MTATIHLKTEEVQGLLRNLEGYIVVRPVKPQPPAGYDRIDRDHPPQYGIRWENTAPPLGMWTKNCPYGNLDAWVQVRETWACCSFGDHPYVRYKTRTDPWPGDAMLVSERREIERHAIAIANGKEGWHASAHMPIWAIRLELVVTDLDAKRHEDGLWYWHVRYKVARDRTAKNLPGVPR